MEKIGFGGSCHWCTEAIFQSIRGVNRVDQGWISSTSKSYEPSEAVIVEFDPITITLNILIAVHLYSHSCTSRHQLRSKYRSAIYFFDKHQPESARLAINALQEEFDKSIITAILPFQEFRRNQEHYLNYYYSNPKKPFCGNIVSPKLQSLKERFSEIMISKTEVH